MSMGKPPYPIATYIETVRELNGRIHPTAITVATMHLEEAIRAHLTGDEAETMRRLSLIDQRINAEQDWLTNMVTQRAKEVETR